MADMNIEEATKRIFEVIADRHFSYLKNKSVLELGPFHGIFSNKILEQTTEKLTCIEYNKEAVRDLQVKFQSKANFNIVVGDMHFEIPKCGPHDAAVVYGVLYHSASPFLILEHIANYINPEFILLEVWDLGLRELSYHHEKCNEPGYRFADFKTCGIALDIPMEIWSLAMTNLGYKEVDRFLLKELYDYKQIILECPEATQKKDGIYTVWQRQI